MIANSTRAWARVRSRVRVRDGTRIGRRSRASGSKDIVWVPGGYSTVVERSTPDYAKANLAINLAEVLSGVVLLPTRNGVP